VTTGRARITDNGAGRRSGPSARCNPSPASLDGGWRPRQLLGLAPAQLAEVGQDRRQVVEGGGVACTSPPTQRGEVDKPEGVQGVGTHTRKPSSGGVGVERVRVAGWFLKVAHGAATDRQP
jgi:hypothetical protein